MDKLTKILMVIWVVLAIASFTASFWAPLVIKIIGIVFGAMNLMIIGSWVVSLRQGRKEYKRQQMLLENKEEE